MTELSPAAKAVLDASKSVYWRPVIDVPYCQSRVVAAALRAAADQVVPLQLPPETTTDTERPSNEWHSWNAEQQARFALLAIATELEAQ